MELLITEELISICKYILDQNLTQEEWMKRYSDDAIQTNHFCGGFDAIEKEFTFSYYDEANNEFWFQITLDEVRDIVNGNINFIKIRPAE